MSRYFKASEKKSGRHVMIEVYDEPKKPSPFGLRRFKGDEIGIWEYMDESGLHHIEEGTDLYDLYHIHEISETEYKIYKTCQHIIVEFWMHGKTGGFPSEYGVLEKQKSLSRYIRDFFRNERESEADMIANAFSKMIKAATEDPAYPVEKLV